MSRTRYYVLRQEENGFWTEYSNDVEATSRVAAVKAVVSDEDGRYVAVPHRSWKPLTVTLETKRLFSIENGN